MAQINIVLYQTNFIKDWRYDVNPEQIAELARELDAEFNPAGVRVIYTGQEEHSVKVGGYQDILNAVRLRSPESGDNHCLGHIIGASQNCDILADIRRGVSKLAFAPETIMPDDNKRKVCHNCGCGC